MKIWLLSFFSLGHKLSNGMCSVCVFVCVRRKTSWTKYILLHERKLLDFAISQASNTRFIEQKHRMKIWHLSFSSLGHKLSTGICSVCVFCVCAKKNILNKIHFVAREKTPRFRKYSSFKSSYYRAEAWELTFGTCHFFSWVINFWMICAVYVFFVCVCAEKNILSKLLWSRERKLPVFASTEASNTRFIEQKHGINIWHLSFSSLGHKLLNGMCSVLFCVCVRRKTSWKKCFRRGEKTTRFRK